MALVRRHDVVHIRLDFADGSAEEWTFPVEANAYYQENTNTNTERNPNKEDWHEHVIRWTSGRKREMKKKK